LIQLDDGYDGYITEAHTLWNEDLILPVIDPAKAEPNSALLFF
jgi:hypothetical protein